MKKLIYLMLSLGIIITISCTQKPKIKVEAYPETNKTDVVDTYFGTEVSDPYRWLENDTSAETEAWVKAQTLVTFDYLEQIPFRDKINERLTALWNYPKYSVPFKEGDHYFYFKNDGLQNQSVMYIQDELGGDPEVILDPNTFSEDGTIALSALGISKDGQYLAYGISESGSDWKKIYVMDIDTKEELEDEILWVKFSGISWKDDGFYYSRYNEPSEGMELSSVNENQKVYYHKIGTPQEEDILIYENPEFPMRNYGVQTTEDEKYLILYESESTYGNAIYFMDLGEEGDEFTQLTSGFENEYWVRDNLDETLLIQTDNAAPIKRLALVNLKNHAISNWKTLIPEKENVLEGVSIAGDRIITEYMKDAQSIGEIYDFRGQLLGELALPGPGSLGGFSGDKDENTAFYAFTSFNYPTTIFQYDVAGNTSEVYTESEVDFNPEDYIVKQEFYESKDGTRVPMFIVHKKGIKMNGKNPVFLYGYGGFGASMTPYFSVSRLVFLDNGGVFVIANLRGGGEYGEEWHKAGMKLNKQNVFDDFIAAAEHLIENDYTNTDKIAISGASNGGLLVGACMTQRPDLFKVALPAVGVMDMLRYHNFTIGWAWASDYGTSADDQNMFEYLYGYSPLHNIKDGVEYPATLITTADHDDRVVPAHSFKFAATLQAAHKGVNPVLIRIETKAGHGGGKPTEKIIEELTDEWAFTMYNLGMDME